MAQGPRPARRRVDGVLLLDKPVGLSSNTALQHAKRLYRAEKAGHTGTLDPLASGLLPLCFGEATKFAQTLLDAPKRYLATVRFGVATTTGDAEGETVRECDKVISHDELAAAISRFVGKTVQTPPAYAALKYQGRKYYEYARRGIEIPREPREVEIAALDLVDWTPPDAVLDIACGKGTYIRVLAEDIASAAGSCAHLSALRRTMTGPFALAGAITLDALEAMDAAQRDSLLLSPDAPLAGMARLDVDVPTARAIVEGRAGAAPAGSAGTYRCYGPAGQFLGLVQSVGGALVAMRLTRTDRETKRAD